MHHVTGDPKHSEAQLACTTLSFHALLPSALGHMRRSRILRALHGIRREGSNTQHKLETKTSSWDGVTHGQSNSERGLPASPRSLCLRHSAHVFCILVCVAVPQAHQAQQAGPYLAHNRAIHLRDGSGRAAGNGERRRRAMQAADRALSGCQRASEQVAQSCNGSSCARAGGLGLRSASLPPRLQPSLAARLPSFPAATRREGRARVFETNWRTSSACTCTAQSCRPLPPAPACCRPLPAARPPPPPSTHTWFPPPRLGSAQQAGINMRVALTNSSEQGIHITCTVEPTAPAPRWQGRCSAPHRRRRRHRLECCPAP